MAELNLVATDVNGNPSLIQTPQLNTVVQGYNFQDTGNGYLEYGTGTNGSLPFRVNEDGSFVTGNINVDVTNGPAAFFGSTYTGNHVVTIHERATSGAVAALNVVSDNPAFSAMLLSGTESGSTGAAGHGTLKIKHTGQPDGSDSACAAISIDTQVAGTASQGIFITGTFGDSTGNAFDYRGFNGNDLFVVKGGTGQVGVNIAGGATPGGQVEIHSKDTSTIGLFIKAVSAGADCIQVQDSSAVTRFEVTAGGSVFMKGTQNFCVGNFEIGSGSADFGGATAALCMKPGTIPSSSPSSGMLLYIDGSGNLLARTSAGNIRTIAAV